VAAPAAPKETKPKEETKMKVEPPKVAKEAPKEAPKQSEPVAEPMEVDEEKKEG